MKRSAVAVGVFDGVHLGHVEIVRQAVARARRSRQPAVVVTFDPHPDLVLSNRFHVQAPLTPLPEKRARLAALGVDVVDVLPFTREMAALPPEAFVERYLIERHGLETLVVGENFALGKGRAGDPTRLAAIGKERGFEVIPVPLRVVDGAPVSSTRIRAHLEAGRVALVEPLLGRRYELDGVVVRGEGIGRTLGVPTANLRLGDEKLLPADGIYAVWTRLPGVDAPWPGAMSIGVRPTFGGQVRTLEVHVVDWSGELVGKPVGVEFVEWLRPELRFDGPEALIVAMQDDIARVRQRLGAGAVPLAQPHGSSPLERGRRPGESA